jgi:hypothetical protein
LQFIVIIQRGENAAYVGPHAPNVLPANLILQNHPSAVQRYCEHLATLQTKRRYYGE